MKKTIALFVCLCLCILNIWSKQTESFTPLQQAVLAGDYTKAVRLLDEDPGSIDDPAGDEYIETASGEEVYVEGATALHIALAVQDERMVQLLVDRGADLHLTDDDDRDAMLYAVSYSSVPCLEILLDIDSKLLSRRYSSNYDSTPLHWAARYNTVDMVRYLVETCGMDVNVRDEDGDTPLDYADWNSNYDVDVIEYLESAGGLYGGDIPELTPLQQAVLADYTKAVRLLDEDPDSIDDLTGDKYIKTASGEEVYVEGATALHIALAVQDERMVQLLVDRGADLYLTDDDDWDAVLYAVSYSSVPCLEILLKKEERLLSRRYSEYYDSTPLHWAARYNTVDMVRYLVETCAGGVSAVNPFLKVVPANWLNGRRESGSNNSAPF